VKGIRQVAVRFSEQMVPFGDPRTLASPFEIQCPEAGKARWADGKNWTYDFDRDLPGGVQCEFVLKSDIRSLSGKEIEGQKRFQFSTGGPAIRHSEPRAGSQHVDEEQIFILTLDAEPNEDSILSQVSFSVSGIFEQIGVRIIRGEDRERLLKSQFRENKSQPVVLIQSKQRFPADAKVVLNWGKGVMSKTGIATERDQPFHFQTRKLFTADFRCEREHPDKGCFPISSMAVYFSAHVSWDIARKVVLKDESGRQWRAESGENNENKEDRKEKQERIVQYISFKAPFPANTKFKIELPPAFVDDAGRRLSNAERFPLSISTDRYPPLAKFPARFGVLESKGDPVLPVTLRNIEPGVKARMLKAGKSDGILEKTQDIIESLKGSIFHISSDKAPDIDPSGEALFWLKKVLAHDRDEYRSREESVFGAGADGAKIKNLTLPKPQKGEASEAGVIPLKEPGFYVVEIESNRLGA